ncbi:MAG: ferritin-like domain-containing protein [Ginsengibacter sp.]
MNVQHILNEIEKTDPEVYNKLDTRRDAMKSFFKASGKVALATVPIAFGSMFKKAYGGNTATIVEVLNYALTLEYLESEFYKAVVAAPGLTVSLTGAGRAALTTIRDHEIAHVAFLRSAIMSLSATPVTYTASNFDLTGGNSAAGTGPFSGTNSVLLNYDIMLAVAQVFEDTGVRAYKGAAGDLNSNNDILTAALQIHSVEARHAAHLRYMRKNAGVAVKPWITLNQSGVPAPFDAAVQPSYNGEETTTQATVNIVNIGGQTISANAASEAFDEPLTMAQVLAIVDPFII